MTPGRLLRSPALLRELLLAVGDPKHGITGLSNGDLRETLGKQPWGKKYGEKQLSARISRNLALLRNHGLIRKMPNQNRYQLTDASRQLTAPLSVALESSTTELMKMAS